MFGFLDVGIILLVLLSILIGARRGLIGSLAKLLGGFLNVVISILLTKPVATLVSKMKFTEHLFDKLSNKFLGVSDKFGVNLVGMAEPELDVFVGDALSDAKIPKIFRGLFQNLLDINPETLAAKESVTLAELMGVAVGNIIILVLTFVVLCLILWLVSKIVLVWSRKQTRKDTVLAKTNKWLGSVFGLIKAFIILFLGFIVISALSQFSFMENVTEYVNKSLLGGPLYRLSEKLLNNSFDINSLINEWLTK